MLGGAGRLLAAGSRGSVSDLTAAETQHQLATSSRGGYTHYTHYTHHTHTHTQAHVCTLHTTQCTVTTTTLHTHQTPSSRSHAAPQQQPRPASTLGPAVVPIAGGDRSLVQRHTTVPSRAQHLQHSNTVSPSLTFPAASHSLFSFLGEIGRPTPGVRNQLLIYSHLRGLIVSTWKICQTSFLSFWHCLNKCATNMLNIHFSKSTRTQLTGNDLNISRVNNIHGTCDSSVTVLEHSPCSHYILEYN